jgi:hypothetical protein
MQIKEKLSGWAPDCRAAAPADEAQGQSQARRKAGDKCDACERFSCYGGSVGSQSAGRRAIVSFCGSESNKLDRPAIDHDDSDNVRGHRTAAE